MSQALSLQPSEEIDMQHDNSQNANAHASEPRNKGKLIGAKLALQPKHVYLIDRERGLHILERV